MKPPTEEQLRRMTPDGRMTVRSHAVKLGGKVGDALVALIDSLNLPMSSGGMSSDDPVYREMRDIVWSAEGKAAALKATADGHPAMAEVDPLLQRLMGPRYRVEAQGTVTAGALVGEVMAHLGYTKGRDARLPPNCIAKTAATWRRKLALR